MKNKKAAYIIMAIAIVAIAVVAFFAIRQIVSRNEKVPGQESYRLELRDEPIEAPDIQFLDMDDNIHLLSDYRGKTVIVNFWAIYCPPCVEELPDFNRAVAVLEDKNAVIIAINISEGKTDIRDFKQQLNLDNLSFFRDLNFNASQTYGIDTIPRTVVIDKNGYVVSAVVGAVSYEDLVHIADEVD